MGSVVIIAGPPRSGSMWTYNVTRALLTAAGKFPLPREVPSNQAPFIEKALTTRAAENECYCVKTHKALKPGLPGVRIISPFRDVRESVASYMRFMHIDDFNVAVEAARDMMNVTDFYRIQHAGNVLMARFDHIASQPHVLLRRICDFLQVDVGDEDLQEIAERFSRQRIEGLMEELNAFAAQSGDPIGDSSRFTKIRNVDGSFRVFDKATGFQTDHVALGGHDWRVFFSPEQQRKLTELSREWLVRNNFAV